MALEILEDALLGTWESKNAIPPKQCFAFNLRLGGLCKIRRTYFLNY